MGNSKSLRRAALAVALSSVLVASGCSTRVHNRGHVIDPVAVNEIAIGFHQKSDIEELMGSPSTIGTFDQDVWYYIHEQTKQKAFLEPTVTKRQILAIHFDGNGLVREIGHYGLDDGKNIAIVERETPTAGNDTTLLQELFGDIGRFATPSRPGIPGAP